MSDTTRLLLVYSVFNLIFGFWLGVKAAAWAVRKDRERIAAQRMGEL